MNGVVTINGQASRVVLYLSAGPNGAGPFSYVMTKSEPGTWVTTVTAPVPGDYHYTVGVFDNAGQRTIADNDAWNIRVTAAPGSAGNGPQALPDDIPLAPPFSYGSPVAAVFSAAGNSINGSEVISSSRPDVSTSIVGAFYTTHLPRAGWVVDSSSGTAPEATSFSIVASQGSQVCLVQYSGGTVRIYYGTTGS
ncbi:MAG: hypothetical protein ACR2GA_06325 [Chloroflexota bacterium]